MIRTSWFIVLRQTRNPYTLEGSSGKSFLAEGTVVTETWYWNTSWSGDGSAWNRHRKGATPFRSREEADSVAFTLTAECPTLIGLVSVERLRHRL